MATTSIWVHLLRSAVDRFVLVSCRGRGDEGSGVSPSGPGEHVSKTHSHAGSAPEFWGDLQGNDGVAAQGEEQRLQTHCAKREDRKLAADLPVDASQALEGAVEFVPDLIAQAVETPCHATRSPATLRAWNPAKNSTVRKLGGGTH
ncbi:uncharacterized protein PgNI_09070 [Pyricularia grisea]|uniref:Uncharacterized protein n=1 Tax=Pyricularia grisea TaxID=148305 RepID=A0A6P8ARL0_PYRGI|nr:uncharacterized protein PgNI_09070 [Pyricularia grisea]TLD04771.1 hypothetical protein PgNI_09070 [Pyricularia grisea]